MDEELQKIARLIRERNSLDEQIAGLINRPMSIGNLGEYIASKIFQIQLMKSGSAKAIDGHFELGPLKDRSVNIKWYAKKEGLLDLPGLKSPFADFYLVLTGPRIRSKTSNSWNRPWLLDSVYLFDGLRLRESLEVRGVAIGIATSLRSDDWEQAEIWPRAINPTLPLSSKQTRLLKHFSEHCRQE